MPFCPWPITALSPDLRMPPSFVSEDWEANHFPTLPKILPQLPYSYAKEPLSSTTFSFYDSFFLSIPTPYGSWDIYSVCIDSFIEQMFD